ncbi:MAG: hypothetical protein II931_02510 [Clostridia bacterium]|nr:hypothetical protein [Clostridia bacterium]
MRVHQDKFNGGSPEHKVGKMILAAIIFIEIISVFVWLSSFNRNIIIWIIDAIFFGFGLWCFFGYPQQLKAKTVKLTEKVSAMLSEVKEIVHFDKIRGNWKTYFATYEFKFRGKIYKVQSKEEYDEEPTKGKDTELLIDPDKPEEIYEVEREMSRIKLMKIVGAAFIFFGLFMIVNYFV